MQLPSEPAATSFPRNASNAFVELTSWTYTSHGVYGHDSSFAGVKFPAVN